LSSGPQSAGGTGKLRVTLHCELEEVRPAVERIRQFLIMSGCAEKPAFDCELALIEACTNAIQHVPAQEKKRPVIIETNLERTHVEFQVMDHTAGFVLPEESSLPNLESERGRGLFLIQAVMDSVQYIRQETGNVLVLRKKFGSTGQPGNC
jgi:anti-sigma regulatory factor (Ser/Thr protein kinase)